MLDRDLAELYGVSTKRLNEQVRRNLARFPRDFMLQLTLAEANAIKSLRSQIATLNRGQHAKYRPFAFTEHGAVMPASILNSQTAIEASIYVVRTFIRLRQLVSSHKHLADRLRRLESKTEEHEAQIQSLFDAMREPLEPEETQMPRIGFRPEGAPSARERTQCILNQMSNS